MLSHSVVSESLVATPWAVVLSVHGISQARILEWVAISYSRGSSWPSDQTSIFYVSCTGRQILHHCPILLICGVINEFLITLGMLSWKRNPELNFQDGYFKIESKRAGFSYIINIVVGFLTKINDARKTTPFYWGRNLICILCGWYEYLTNLSVTLYVRNCLRA